jgi:hypothetical protein
MSPGRAAPKVMIHWPGLRDRKLARFWAVLKEAVRVAAVPALLDGVAGVPLNQASSSWIAAPIPIAKWPEVPRDGWMMVIVVGHAAAEV